MGIERTVVVWHNSVCVYRGTLRYIGTKKIRLPLEAPPVLVVWVMLTA